MARKFTIDDMYHSQGMFWSLEYRDFYHKTFEETIVVYQADEQYIEKVRERAKAVLSKAPHYEFLKENIFEFNLINEYAEKHFQWVKEGVQNTMMDYSDNPEIHTFYLCWFIVVCLEKGYLDDVYEFDFDLDSAISFFDQINHGMLIDVARLRLYRELKRWFIAYRILCDAKYKLIEGIDLEYWYCEPKKRDPKDEWYCYYLPINLNLYRGTKWPEWENLMIAREKIRKKLN